MRQWRYFPKSTVATTEANIRRSSGRALMAAAAALTYWLVDHPAISGFRWDPDLTPFSSLRFLFLTISIYLSSTLLLRLLRPSPPPSLLRLISTLHNLVLLVLSAAMAAGCISSSLSRLPSLSSSLCFPRGTLPDGPIFFWAYIFYLSKIYELLDTLLIILSGGGFRRLTFLHVYHHAGVVAMCYVWLSTSQSLLPVALVTNSAVHVVMYSYYLSCSVGLRWPARWKKAVTEIQIWQFVFSFAVSVVFLWLHFGSGGGGGCEGFGGWVFNAVFNASLLALFLDFRSKAYGKRIKDEGKRM